MAPMPTSTAVRISPASPMALVPPSADASAPADASRASSVSAAATLYPRAEAGTPRAEPVCGEGL